MFYLFLLFVSMRFLHYTALMIKLDLSTIHLHLQILKLLKSLKMPLQYEFIMKYTLYIISDLTSVTYVSFLQKLLYILYLHPLPQSIVALNLSTVYYYLITFVTFIATSCWYYKVEKQHFLY